jgi:hypothetical protein
MKTSTVPIICGFALTAMSTATLSHWWSVQQFIVSVDARALATTPPRFTPQPAPTLTHIAPKTPDLTTPTPDLTTPKPTPKAPEPDSGQKEFYESLIAKMNGLQTQNRDLLDQLAETNRDLMKLEFRVDTHSESFRPLPVTEDQPFTRLNDESGVLPPRADPVFFPAHE